MSPNQQALCFRHGLVFDAEKDLCRRSVVRAADPIRSSFEHIHLERTKAHSNLTGSIWDSGHASFHGGSDEPDGYVCDICAALSLAASAQIAIPPVLPTRFALHVVISATPTDAAPTRSPWVDFRSRAPPFA